MRPVPHRLIEGCLDRGARDRVEGRLHLHPRRVPARVRGPRRRAVDEAQRGRTARRRRHRRPPRRGRVHLRRGDGAARLARGAARAAAAEAAVPAGARALRRADADQQRLHDRDASRSIARAGRGESSPRPAPPTCARHRDLLDLRQRRAARATTSSSSGSPMRELIYDDVGGGIPDGRELKASSPAARRCPAPDARPDRRAARLRLARRELATFFGAAVADRRSTTAAAWCSSRFARRSSTCTSRAASARRAARGRAGWCRSCEKIEDGRAASWTTSSCCSSRSATGSSASASCALGDVRRRCRSSSYVAKWRDEFVAAHRAGPAARSAATRRSRASSRRATSTRTRASPPGGARVSAGPRARHASPIDEREVHGAEGDRARRGGALRPGSRFPSSATSRGSARRSAPAACASVEVARARRSRRPAAR